MRLFVACLFIAAAITACDGAPATAITGTAFMTTIRTTDGTLPLPVSLSDETGVVTAIAPAHADGGRFLDAGILADPGNPNAFILTWLGGMCDKDVELTLRSINARHDLHFASHEGLGACPAAGVLRAVSISTREPLELAAITVSGNKSIQLVRDDDCGPLTAAETSDAKEACGVLIEATVGDDPAPFSRVTVRPADGACPGAECATNAGIEAQPWLVQATSRAGGQRAWRCTYRPETATCTEILQPAAS